MGVSIPGVARPNNLVVGDEQKLGVIDGDLYNICGRVAEISRRLYIVEATSRGHADCTYLIMEHCEDNVDRLIFKVKELDARVLKKLEWIMGVPFEERYKQLEKENHEFEEQYKAEELEKLWETIGGPMWSQLEHDGFSSRPVSYPKKGVAQANRRK